MVVAAPDQLRNQLHEIVSDQEKRERLLKQYRTHCDESFKGVPEISSEELLQILMHPSADVRSSTVLVDCRSEAEQIVSMFPGAVTIAELEGNLEKYKDKELIAYCAIGRRSGCFTKRILEAHPELKIRNHVGGILDWSHVRGPLVDPVDMRSSTARMHPGGVPHLKHLPTSSSIHIVFPTQTSS